MYCLSSGGKTTYENVLEVLGAVDTEVFSALLRQVLAKDVTGAIRTVDHLVDQGRELGQMVNDFTWYMRNLLLIQSADDMEEVLDMSADHLAALKEENRWHGEAGTLIRYIRIFSELSSQIGIRHRSAHPAGDCNYQALPSTDRKEICRHSMSVWMIWSRN